MFEEQKVAIDQRYRKLLEDCIQDAVFLSSRNSELTTENQSLKHREYCVQTENAIHIINKTTKQGIQLVLARCQAKNKDMSCLR